MKNRSANEILKTNSLSSDAGHFFHGKSVDAPAERFPEGFSDALDFYHCLEALFKLGRQQYQHWLTHDGTKAGLIKRIVDDRP